MLLNLFQKVLNNLFLPDLNSFSFWNFEVLDKCVFFFLCCEHSYSLRESPEVSGAALKLDGKMLI